MVLVQEVNAILESIKTTMTKIYRDLQERETIVKYLLPRFRRLYIPNHFKL